MAVLHPEIWQNEYLEILAKSINMTRERVRQMLYKAAWDNWNANAINILGKHVTPPIQTHFEYVKPNHIEFISLISEKLSEKYQIV